MKLAYLDAALAGVFFGVVACGPAPDESLNTGCELRIDLAPEAVEVGEAAMARINRATGCQVKAADDGVPLSLVTAALDDNGQAQCGTTLIERNAVTGAFLRTVSIELSTEVDGCNSIEAIAIHEIFHAMLGTKGVHAERGCFAAVSGSGESINESTLVTVCSHVACPAFSPEP